MYRNTSADTFFQTTGVNQFLQLIFPPQIFHGIDHDQKLPILAKYALNENSISVYDFASFLSAYETTKLN